MENHLRKTNNNNKGKSMRSLLIALLFGVLFTMTGFSQEKNEKGCCSSDKSKTTMHKNCDAPDEVSNSSNDKKDLMASVQGDDKNKKSLTPGHKMLGSFFFLTNSPLIIVTFLID